MSPWERLISELLIIEVELLLSLGANHHNDWCPWQAILAGSSLGTRTPLISDVYKKDSMMAKELKELREELGAIRPRW
jgi:hypothetical protein